MLTSLIELYTKGDLAQLSNKLLHSTSWKQHDFTAYGHLQAQNLWLNSLAQFGFLSLTKQQLVQGNNFSALYLELTDDASGKSTSLSLFVEHNDNYIKRVHCNVDTVALAQLMNISPQALIAQLPSADPLRISQFDHQLHPQSYHAMPDDLCELPQSMGIVITQWWNIWQHKDLSGLAAIYRQDAKISIAGFDAIQNHIGLRDFQLQLHHQINRSYCQLENICVDKERRTVAISWQIDGDYKLKGAIKRLRIPVISILTIDNNVIVEEQLQIDWLAICKGFDLPYPLL